MDDPEGQPTPAELLEAAMIRESQSGKRLDDALVRLAQAQKRFRGSMGADDGACRAHN